tara:strand:- start:1209 stop:1745 length:537 start_codon:yes stop_codon:yes gene_type:complete
MIIGIVGRDGSGKDTAAEFFVKKNFKSISLSDELRTILREEGKSIAREVMQQRTYELRKEKGPAYLAERIIPQLEGNVVISSIRHTAEVELLKKKGMKLIAIDAPFATRFERIKNRADKEDDITEEIIKKREEDQQGSQDAAKMQMNEVFNMADKVVMNDGTKEELNKKLESITETLS